MEMTKGARVGKQYTLTVQRRPFNISAWSTGRDAWLGGFGKLEVREAKRLKGVDTSVFLQSISLLMKMITAEIIVLYYMERKVDAIISIQYNYSFS